MNFLGSEGREVKIKVATRSDVKNFDTPYLLNGLKNYNQIWGPGAGEGKGRYKVKYLSELLRWVEASTNCLCVHAWASKYVI